MFWSALILAAALGPADGTAVDSVAAGLPSEFTDYTTAWHAAKNHNRPMLVILNPPSEDCLAPALDGQKLRSDDDLRPLLENYVLTVIDTGTEHGQKVNELFGAKPLPRIVVIDREQKTQVFASSERISKEQLIEVLDHYRQADGSSKPFRWTKTPQPQANCPSCQYNWQWQ